ncbi:ScbR family autoregulator-binding transcription factor [Streptomyces fragilis]|uniref:ScbR family autoregulator-binding transcription factor n=1 Tax=Streptomyces fragilis TaxID=67301 RepID=A0ABV2YFH7_9ACTN|nr:ScbR family autoregulator-binding transcription factor [Streptomyces fragilis]
MPRQERAVRTRNQLLTEAASSFRRHGFSRSRLTEISRNAGVSSGALYFHFSGKEELAAAVEAEAIETLRSAALDVRHSRTSPLQSLIDTSHALVAALRSSLVTQVGLELNCDRHTHNHTDLRQEWHGCVQRLLAEADRAGALLPHVSRQAAASVIVASTVGFDVLGREDEQWISAGVLTSLWQLLLPSLVVPEHRAALNPAGTSSVFDTRSQDRAGSVRADGTAG